MRSSQIATQAPPHSRNVLKMSEVFLVPRDAHHLAGTGTDFGSAALDRPLPVERTRTLLPGSEWTT